MKHTDEKQPTSIFLEKVAQLFEDQGDAGQALLIRDQAKLWSITEEAQEIINHATEEK